MKLRPADYPVVIRHLVDAFVAAAKDRGVRGVASVHEVDEGSVRHYEIVVQVAAGETVGARAQTAKALRGRSREG